MESFNVSVLERWKKVFKNLNAPPESIGVSLMFTGKRFLNAARIKNEKQPKVQDSFNDSDSE